MPRDYGYFGKGPAGYAHYMTAFKRNQGGGGGGGGGAGHCHADRLPVGRRGRNRRRFVQFKQFFQLRQPAQLR